MKRLIFLILLILSISSISKAQYYPYIPRLTNISNTWDTTQTYSDIKLNEGISFRRWYNINGDQWDNLISPEYYLDTLSNPNGYVMGYFRIGDESDNYTDIKIKGASILLSGENGITIETADKLSIPTDAEFSDDIVVKYNEDSTNTFNIYLQLLFHNDIIPNSTRLRNNGGSSNYWLNTYTQNAYIDTVKTDLTLARNVMTDSTITAKSYKQKSVVTIADSTINCNLSNAFQKTLGATQRFVFTNFGDGQTVNVAVTNTASNYTVTWVNPDGLTIKWTGNITPVQTIGAKTDIWTFIRFGTIIYGNVVQDF